MSPNMIGVVVGVTFILPTIYLFRVKNIEAQMWPVFLMTLPIFYMLFGVLILDTSVILNELLHGLPFILGGLLAWKVKNKATLFLLGVGWCSHGLYDYFHDIFFINHGVFSWYPAFCAVVDIIVGLYILTQGHRFRHIG